MLLSKIEKLIALAKENGEMGLAEELDNVVATTGSEYLELVMDILYLFLKDGKPSKVRDEVKTIFTGFPE